MSQIMKAFTGIFIVLMIMATGTGVLGAFLQVYHAQNLYSLIIDELENSNYAIEVIEDCYETAGMVGYELELILYQDNEAAIVIHSTDEIPEMLDLVSMAEVTLRYPVQIRYFSIDTRQELVGYAR